MWLVGPENIDGVDALAPYLLIDRFALFFDFVICLGGAMAALLAGGYLPEHGIERGEFYPLLMFSTVGAMVLAAAGDLLVAVHRPRDDVARRLPHDRLPPRSRRSTEAALKYFLLGSFAAACCCTAARSLYGATGHTDLAGIGQRIASAAGGQDRRTGRLFAARHRRADARSWSASPSR